MINLKPIVSVFLVSLLVRGSVQLPTGESTKAKESLWTLQHRDVKQSTTLPDGRIIDWIPIESQADTIATAPPSPGSPQQNTSRPVSELETGEFPLGPPGTVPVLRVEMSALEFDPLMGKRAPPLDSSKQRRQNAGVHWYASSYQQTRNTGTSGGISMFKPYVQSNSDFSLLQTAEARNNPQGQLQTVEAGWQNYPGIQNDVALFTFFNTNGYTAGGDNLGGYNQLVKGWVQVDSTVFPGTHFSTHSVIGGAQYTLSIQYSLQNGNWWLSVNNVWIGYYPASLFGDTSNSLAGGADYAFWYGEIAQSEQALTTTDMGSGNFPEKGWQQAGYISNIQVTTPSGTSAYNPTSTTISDSNRYRLSPFWNSGTNWGSYMYLGGPGAGGVVGG